MRGDRTIPNIHMYMFTLMHYSLNNPRLQSRVDLNILEKSSILRMISKLLTAPTPEQSLRVRNADSSSDGARRL